MRQLAETHIDAMLGIWLVALDQLERRQPEMIARLAALIDKDWQPLDGVKIIETHLRAGTSPLAASLGIRSR